ncbi:hypothetical protein ACFVGY_23855 [Streptomyces sp. NPDC127106]|uniref:hypothetical protein n=1 Tax=Streptomyces sp. NPDC127106 TaxID=3345360 RepID=UPI003644D938
MHSSARPRSSARRRESAALPPAFSARKRMTVLTWGLGADSTANILRFINDPVGNGLEPDLSDLVIVHAVTGDEFRDSLSYADRLVLPLLRAWRIRLVQVCRGGPRDADGVLVLDDSRAPRRIHAAGPWRLSDELRTAGTVPMLASGQRRCSIRFKGWVLDTWAAHEFGTETFRRVIGYHADETGRALKDSAIQDQLNTAADRIICEPDYPLIRAGMNRAAVEQYVLDCLGEMILKSHCVQCPFTGVCSSRDLYEQRLRVHPAEAAQVLRMEHISLALNERMSLYGPAGSLRRRLAEDDRNRPVLDAFQADLEQTPYAVYEVRRITGLGRTKDCRRWHGKDCAEPKWWCSQQRKPRCRRIHTVVDQGGAPLDAEPQCPGDDERCRGEQQKGPTWRSVRTVYEGPRERAEELVTRFAGRFPERVRLVVGETSGIRRAHYLPESESLPHAEAFVVAAPAGVADKQRPGFEKRWTEHTGGKPVFRPLRDLPEQAPRRRSAGGPAPLHRAKVIGDVLLIA